LSAVERKSERREGPTGPQAARQVQEMTSLPPQPPPGLKAEIIAAAFDAGLDAARSFVGATAPNPPVGCVLLDAAGMVLACEAHARAGSPHAEAQAIARCREAGTDGRIDTLVVTLEPCNHHGRTPPCTEAILATPARTVWFGEIDPNPRVAGGGGGRLAAAGLEVRPLAGLASPHALRLQRGCRELIAPYAKHARTGLPWVTVKQALDATGGMIPPPGAKTFTSPASLDLAHQLRRRADAILTGSGTILADAPAFTVRRVADHPAKRRWLVILDRRGRVPEAYITAARERGFEVRVETDLRNALAKLGSDGALEVLIEAGPQLLAAVLAQDLWDEQVIITKSAAADVPDSVRIIRRADQ
jgi:diaminohydroxyphosphoribosylaminopyrimidine deaminase/5-amino-6-(5-phosphoribosylamino)uracil reductase